jgi:hypothetical protein
MSQLLCFKETCHTQIAISGVMCQVNASYVNGMVQGKVCSSLSSKPHEFEFEPMRFLQKKSLIIAEVKRLYWEYFPSVGNQVGPNRKIGLVLCHKAESECDPYDYNFLDK